MESNKWQYTFSGFLVKGLARHLALAKNLEKEQFNFLPAQEATISSINEISLCCSIESYVPKTAIFKLIESPSWEKEVLEMRIAYEWKRDDYKVRVVPARYCLDVLVQNEIYDLKLHISGVHVVNIINSRGWVTAKLIPKCFQNDHILFRLSLLNHFIWSQKLTS